MVGLVPTVHPTSCSGVRGWLESRDKLKDDSGDRMFDPEHSQCGSYMMMAMPSSANLDPHGDRRAGNHGRIVVLGVGHVEATLDGLHRNIADW